MITIDQLLESVDLDFEPRWVTKDEEGSVEIWSAKPYPNTDLLIWNARNSSVVAYMWLKLAEFENKPWQECIYEVPRKQDFFQNGKIENFTIFDFEKINKVVDKLNLLVDAVNKLKGANNE